MPLEPGTQLGPYEITGPLGAGGMGEVYRARDPRLERTVAIKILPAQLSSDPVRKQRFEREAKTVSNLNHPNICVLHDVGSQNGVDYLVMECVEGESLAKRLERGALPLEQVLKFGAQIADALDKAHRSGVVHRDLKPGNIMLTATGVKLLDFGLAKIVPPLITGATLSATAPNRTRPLTHEGSIVGTFQYMSPEQLEGKELDARSDIFSLGAVLYEMLTGQRAFEGKSQLSVASAILEKEPVPIANLRPLTPPALDFTIRRCLAKNVDERWQTASDLASQLRWISETGSQAGAAIAEKTMRVPGAKIAWGVAAFAAAAAILFAVDYERRAPDEPRLIRASILPPEKATLTPIGVGGGPVTISPDGKLLVFSAQDDTHRTRVLWVRPLDSSAAHALEGTDDGSYPFWSPDSRYVGFFSNGKLKKISVVEGPPQTLCDAIEGRGGSWNKDGVIVFTPTIRTPLIRISEAGGTPTPVTTLSAPADNSHRWPFFLPDGRHFLFFGRGKTNGIYVGDLDTGQFKFLLVADSNPVYSPSGNLLWWQEGTVMAQPFDAARLQLSGSAVPVAQHVLYSYAQSYGVFTESQNGTLAYQSDDSFGGTRMTWIDRSGKNLGEVAVGLEEGFNSQPRVSPDGRRIAVTRSDVAVTKEDIWIFDPARGAHTRLTFSETARSPVWSPDGSQIAYGSIPAKPGTSAASPGESSVNVYVKPSNGAGQEALAFEAPGLSIPWGWSPDGRYLALIRRISNSPTDKIDIWILPMAGAGEHKPFPYLQTAFSNAEPKFSPDGKWIAYSSNESGAYEVNVASFPNPTTRVQASIQGGQSPVWRADGKELYYRAQEQVFGVDVEYKGPTLQLGTPHLLFSTGPLPMGSGLIPLTQPYDVSPRDGRFLVAMSSSTAASPINVVLNWNAALKKR
jgi:eukaryotic-like serine/threonine-protein kinase